MDPLDARQVLSALTHQADQALARGGYRCLRAVPRIDGSLYFELEHPGGRARLDWLAPGADGRVRLAWSAGIPQPDAQGEATREALAGLLERLAAEPGFGLLGFCNRELLELRFDDRVVDVLLADRFGPGRTRWFGYRFQGASQDRAEAFRLIFAGPDGELVFEVSRPGTLPGPDGAERLLSTAWFCLDLLADPRPREHRRLLPHQVERFLGFALSRAVHPALRLVAQPAPETGRPGPDVPVEAGSPAGSGTDRQPDRRADGADSFDGAPVSTTRWGNPEQWYQFFSDFEVERSSLCSVRFTDPVSYVLHGEMECRGIEPNTFGKRVDFVNSPWPDEPVEPVPGSEGHFTGLVEQDAILGGTAKLELALEKAMANPEVRLICLNNTCLPKIIGDDAASVIARMRARSPVPILNMNTDLDSPEAAYRDLARQARQAVAEEPAPAERAGLNLVGFPPGRGRRELTAQLEECGLSVNCRLIPEIGVADLRRYLAGRASLVYPHGPWVDLAERLLSDLGVELLELAAPYGLARSRQWFQAACRAAGREEVFSAWVKRRFEPAREAFEALAAQAGDYRLGLVVDRASLERLIDPARLYGFELAPLLEEMGFGLEVLVRSAEEIDAPPEALARALAEPQRHRFRSFAEPDELAGLLAGSEVQAVYSEVFFDRRLSRAGKAQFHLGMLELGLDGALRGLRRLLSICRWPFYRRYGRHLGHREAPR